MLPSYPPRPRHTTGFDMMLIYAGVEDEDHERASRIVRALRRESLRRGARASAAKCLFGLHEWSAGPGHLRAARKLAAEAPGVRAYRCLARAEADAGHAAAARAATRHWLQHATRVGDLDAAEQARLALAAPVGEDVRAPASSYHKRILESAKGAQGTADPYEALSKLTTAVLQEGGRATAFQCVCALMTLAAKRDDVAVGVRLARQLVALEPSSYSWLAVALALERVGRADDARAGFAGALKHAVREGDIHRATKATAGLLRTGGSCYVTKQELGWAMGEAEQEPAGAPKYLYLRAALGLV